MPPSSSCKSYYQGMFAVPDAFLPCPLTCRSNAEAGLTLICTCLPVFVGQSRHLESRVCYGSFKSRNAEINEISSNGDRFEIPRALIRGALIRGTSRARGQTNAADLPDEIELVTHAQRPSMQEGDME